MSGPAFTKMNLNLRATEDLTEKRTFSDKTNRCSLQKVGETEK